MNRLRNVLPALVLAAACAHTEPTPTTPASPAPAPAPAPQAEAKPAPRPEAAATLPGEQVLAKQPEIGPLKSFDAPVPQVTTLPNGLKLYVVERPRGPIEALELVVRRGVLADWPGHEGLATLTASMLETGSAGRSQTQMAAAVDAIGADLHVLASRESTSVSISGLPSRLPEMAGLLSDVALRPNFDKAEWEHLKGQRQAELLAQRAEPVAGARLALGRAVYGAHPMGTAADGTPESVKALTLEQAKDFYRTFSPKDAAIIAVGGASAKDVVAALTQAFGGWKPGKPSPTSAELIARAQVTKEAPRVVLVDYPAKPQTVLTVGQPTVPRASKDYLALEVLNAVLGGSFTSRLNQNLREQHGYTYGARSAFLFSEGPSLFLASSSVKTDVTGDALKEMLGEIDRIVAQPLSPDEVEKGKALLAYQLVRELEHATTAAHEMSQIFIYDLPLDEYRRFVPNLKALTAESIQQAAQRTLTPARLTISVAGDASKVVPQLDALKLPPPQRRNADGQVIQK